MNTELNQDSEYDEGQLADVEHLLKKMSLKRPSNHVVTSPGMSRYSRELAIALACLVAGILIGRIDYVFGFFDPSNSSQNVVSENVETAATDDPHVDAEVKKNNEKPPRSKVQLIDKGMFLVNGEFPVRKYEAVTRKKVRVIDPESGQPIEVVVPVKEVIVTAAPST